MRHDTCEAVVVNAAPLSFLYRPIPMATETAFFILVNVLDVALTLLLLSTGAFRESNPLANFFLTQWGPTGIIAYKFTFVAGIMTIAHFIATRQIGTARGLVNFGSVLIGAVVAYSLYLLVVYLAF